MKVVLYKNQREIIKSIRDKSRKEEQEALEVVRSIIKDVILRGDEALLEYTKKFDSPLVKGFVIEQDLRKRAVGLLDKNLLDSLKKAKANIENYHKRTIEKSFCYKEDNGVILGQRVSPINRVGIYVPGGKASYPSTVLMNAIPAKLAGVKEVVMITPPSRDGMIKDSIIAAAELCGVDEIYTVGGAQGVAALSYGTQTIKPVDKIVGPGNIYVAMAKREVMGEVGIDMIAGPSEVVIVADQWANPRYIAADMIAQAEHDEQAMAILITDWEPLVEKVSIELKLQIEQSPRKEILKKAIASYSYGILTSCLSESLKVADELAPEHLEILTRDPFTNYKEVSNAGAIFLGEYSPEPLGDYYAGPNHTLPTSSTARFSSPLGVGDFVKRSSIIHYPKSALLAASSSIISIAEEEGLIGHANSIRVRLEEGRERYY